ncbi:hypothetical protein CBS147333_9747 [Penicillium roqueforti]|nr:hypothetical protein CBS147354_9626 [Penicillium roqueforti]KAI2735433.1 hypothetical protein DTO013F2_10126 [Penicillium roqueforti]KAI3095574.1 hypothetical protein CBS147333_9747 [Penicillium roqueforti]KAI3119665.1 hypothetical protein CBS147326_9792 [Penicillium roqueforti]KAI3189749.1 hypothetical protein CBS147311_9868 [Penicillium roqueforti]
MYCHSRQPIEDTSFGLAGPIVCSTRPPPQQPTELIYCTPSVYVSKGKREYPRRRTEEIRPQCTSARATGLRRLFVPSPGHQNIQPLTSHQGRKEIASR